MCAVRGLVNGYWAGVWCCSAPFIAAHLKVEPLVAARELNVMLCEDSRTRPWDLRVESYRITRAITARVLSAIKRCASMGC